jgi:hypothetical protein
MTQTVAEAIKQVAVLISDVNFNFDRAGMIAGNLDLNSDEIELMPQHVEFLVVHLQTIEAAVTEARKVAERIAQTIKQPAAVS